MSGHEKVYGICENKCFVEVLPKTYKISTYKWLNIYNALNSFNLRGDYGAFGNIHLEFNEGVTLHRMNISLQIIKKYVTGFRLMGINHFSGGSNYRYVELFLDSDGHISNVYLNGVEKTISNLELNDATFYVLV